MNEPLEARIRQLMGELRDTAPGPADWSHVGLRSHPAGSRRRPAAMAMAAGVIVVAAVALVLYAANRDGTVATVDTPITTVSPTSEPQPTPASTPPPPEPEPVLVVAEPATVTAGSLVELRFPEETFRGAPWHMTEWSGSTWQRDPTYLLIADAEGYDCSACPLWYGPGETWGWEDIGLSGPGPDTVRIPDVAPAGHYRLCSANTGDEVYCVQVTVVDRPSPSELPASTVAPPSTSTSLAPAATAVPDQPGTIDVSGPDLLDPVPGASYRRPAGGTGFVLAAPAGDRVLIVDTAVATASFLDAETFVTIAEWPIPDAAAWENRLLWVGPDDVIYHSTSGARVVAYAAVDGVYLEVASVAHGIGDSWIGLGRAGISTAEPATDPIMAYVGIDGLPSGATLNVDPPAFTVDGTEVRIARGDRTWNLHATGGDCLPDGGSVCIDVEPGPNGTVVLSHDRPGLLDRITVFGEQTTQWDTDWLYVGPLDESLLLIRHHDDGSVDLAVHSVAG